MKLAQLVKIQKKFPFIYDLRHWRVIPKAPNCLYSIKEGRIPRDMDNILVNQYIIIRSRSGSWAHNNQPMHLWHTTIPGLNTVDDLIANARKGGVDVIAVVQNTLRKTPFNEMVSDILIEPVIEDFPFVYADYMHGER